MDVLAALNPRRKPLDGELFGVGTRDGRDFVPRRPQQQLTTGLVFGGQGSAEAARTCSDMFGREPSEKLPRTRFVQFSSMQLVSASGYVASGIE